MNDLENYKGLLEKYFGAGSAAFATQSDVSNDILGALNHTQFEPFRAEFNERFQRLSMYYGAASASRKALIDRLNEMASKTKWGGVHAEIVAFDFLNGDRGNLSEPIELSKTVAGNTTLASSHGKHETNYDGYYVDFDLGFDVKVLGDKSKQIINGVITEAKNRSGRQNVDILPEYPLDMDYQPFDENRKALLAELEDTLKQNSPPSFLQSQVLSGLNYRMRWMPGVLTAVSSYDPFQHAESQHTLLYKHAKKFSKTTPTVIVFVVHPWYSEKTHSVWDTGEVFYRAFCRRFFCQYAKDTRPASGVLKAFTGTETMSEVTRCLSGVLILEDVSVLEGGKGSPQVKPFAYLNPNATHKVSPFFIRHLNTLQFKVDDFAHDNY